MSERRLKQRGQSRHTGRGFGRVRGHMHSPAARRCTNNLQGQCDITMTMDEWDGNLCLSISESNPNATDWMVQNVEIAPPCPSIRHFSCTTSTMRRELVLFLCASNRAQLQPHSKWMHRASCKVMRNRSSPTIGAFCTSMFSRLGALHRSRNRAILPCESQNAAACSLDLRKDTYTNGE